MLKQIRQLFRTKSCHFCKKTTGTMQQYKDTSGKTVFVCHLCVPYAERRGLPKN